VYCVHRTPLRTQALAKPRVVAASSHKDPVEVFCRVRPSAEEEESCIKILSDTTVQLTPPESSRAFVSGKETQYTFKGEKLLFSRHQCWGSGSAGTAWFGPPGSGPISKIVKKRLQIGF
jgi:hypothetical protein